MSTVSNRSAILALVLGSFTLSAQAITVQPEALRKLQVDTGAAITVDQATGQATFMRVPPAAPQLRAAIANPDRAAKARATAFLRTYGAAFGIDDLNTQLQALPASKDAQEQNMPFSIRSMKVCRCSAVRSRCTLTGMVACMPPTAGL